MTKLRALVPAAGSGSRAGLPYPKTLHPVVGVPILVRLLTLLRRWDEEPIVVASPSGRAAIATTLEQAGLAAEIVEQAAPLGMGDAVLCLEQASAADAIEHVLLAWGDIPLLQPATIEGCVTHHLTSGTDITFATRHVDRAYTIVARDAYGDVRELIETREAGVEPAPGEREIGLFVFRREPVLRLLHEGAQKARGRETGEHGFLDVIGRAVDEGCKVDGLPIATELDLISLNRLSDLEKVAALVPSSSAAIHQGAGA